jgi:Putative stress-responsive transcriptional regulator
MEETKKLYRSNTQKVIGGVAGGLGEYFNIDPVIIRVLFVLLILAGGGGLLLYVIMWIFIPQNPDFFLNTNPKNMQEEKNNVGSNDATPQQDKHCKKEGNLMGGLILITLGILFLLPTFFNWLDFGDLWPVLLIVIGAVIIYKHTKK